MGPKFNHIYIGESMISNQEKIDIIVGRLNNIQEDIKSFIEHAQSFQGKYSLQEELEVCDAKKEVLLTELRVLGGFWEPLD